MTIDPDDPRLTAYALGELDAAERQAIEAALAQDERARHVVDEVRALARLLSDQLHTEPRIGLTEAQRSSILARAESHTNRVFPFVSSGQRWLRHAAAAAAMLAVAAGTYVVWLQKYAFQREPARIDAPLNAQFDEAPVKAAAPAPPEPRDAAFVESHDGVDRLELAERPSLLAARERSIAPAAPHEQPAAPAAPAPAPASVASDNGLLAAQSVDMVDAQTLAITESLQRSTVSQAELAGPMQQTERAAEPVKRMLAFRNESGANAREVAVTSSAAEARGGEPEPARRRQADSTAMRGLSAPQAGLPGLAAPESRDQRNAPSSLGRELLPTAPGAPTALQERTAAGQSNDGAARTAALLDKKLDDQPADAEQYAPIVENDFVPVTPSNTLATFSIDVDTASYANVRRFLNQNLWPRRDAVRIEELVNYFHYDYHEPATDVPFSVDTELTECPWNPAHALLRVGLRGKRVQFENRAPSNLVFLVDVSGSMNQPNKLPLVKAGLRMLTEQLNENDTISIATYAGAERLALPPTSGQNRAEILSTIDQLDAGGSTNGAAGITLAYDLAAQNFRKGGINRVILATDGDFNVGLSSVDALTRLAEEKAKSGVFLNVLGFGEGNLKDQTMEQIANKGNGQYNYIDSLLEARKVLVEQVGGTLITIAKDVKIQVDFNPAKVGAYRLIGYENRTLQAEDFRNDAKDAGEIGAGLTVTALFELVPPASPLAVALQKQVEPSQYSKSELVEQAKRGDEWLTVRLRYKLPDAQSSTELKAPHIGEIKKFGDASPDTRFASAVALFGMIVRESKFKGTGTLDAVLEIAGASLGSDPGGYRKEFIDLVRKASALKPR